MNTKIDILCRKISEPSFVPIRLHDTDAAYDLCASESKTISPKAVEIVKTGISIQMPESLCALVLSRSGLAAKNNVFVLNSPGLIDSGYRGEIMVILCNFGEDVFEIEPGMRIAQMLFSSVPDTRLRATFELLDESDRGMNGLGSTGTVALLSDDDVHGVAI